VLFGEHRRWPRLKRLFRAEVLDAFSPVKCGIFF
jgi:hypothetical protein